MSESRFRVDEGIAVLSAIIHPQKVSVIRHFEAVKVTETAALQ